MGSSVKGLFVFSDVKLTEKIIFDVQLVVNAEFRVFWQILVKKSHFGDPTYHKNIFHTYQ